jgi:molybdenum cofactor cytidylyltransferase
VSFVENLRWSDGLGSSIVAGLAAAGNADSVFLLLADQPFVDAAVLLRLRSALASSGLAAAACRYGGTVGPPALFRRALFGELSALEGDEGARRVLGREPGRIALVDFPPGAVDVDTPDDAARIRARFR